MNKTLKFTFIIGFFLVSLFVVSSSHTNGAASFGNVNGINLTQITFPDGTVQTSAANATSGWTDDGSIVRLTTSSNNVGIGTSNPNSTFNVVGTSFFNGDVNITGLLSGGSPLRIGGIDIINNLFMLSEDRNSSSRFTLQNLNSGSNATAVISTINDVGNSMSIGIGSSNFVFGGISYPNITALISRSRGETFFANLYNQPFVWEINIANDNNGINLQRMMTLDSNGLNLTNGTLILNDFETQVSGGSKVVRRNNANGALFGISNNVSGTSANSGAGYVTLTRTGNYTIEVHSETDANNPNETVHHLRGSTKNEIWRLNPDTNGSAFRWEDGKNTPIFKINWTDQITLGRSNKPFNLTMFSPDGSEFTCGVNNAGVFSCT